MIGTRRGRTELRRRAGERLWPVMAYVARSYRVTLGRRPRIVAVVGSVGKTTTMRSLSAVLGRPVSRPALLNMNSHAAIGRALLGVRPWQTRAVLEVGINAPGQMRRQAATVRPNVVVVTAIARDHWESFHSLDAIRDEKAEMVRALPPSAAAVINADDPNVRWMAGQTRARVVLTGEAADAEVRATDIGFDWPHGMSFTVRIGERTWPVRIQLMGRHMVFPALAAIAVAYVDGLSIDAAVAAVGTVEPTPGRMQTMVLPSGAVVIRDEFKGTMDAWLAALDALADIPARRRIAVFGEISEVTGNQDYRDIGQRLGFVDRAIFVSTSKNFQLFRAGATAGGLDRDQIAHARNYVDVLDLLRDELVLGDVVLIRGRWQQALGRIGLALAGEDVQCRADPCPFKRMLCDVCPMLNQPFTGPSTGERAPDGVA
ncbi:MAG TPA: Mur ligase family protein [Candidatus Limnocylindrales bacterium]|nr:Mur ligase family protein [Candidatus Limnocylindrales bacterium]